MWVTPPEKLKYRLAPIKHRDFTGANGMCQEKNKMQSAG
jgi:hypothetical protein